MYLALSARKVLSFSNSFTILAHLAVYSWLYWPIRFFVPGRIFSSIIYQIDWWDKIIIRGRQIDKMDLSFVMTDMIVVAPNGI